jgi:SlyX protein
VTAEIDELKTALADVQSQVAFQDETVAALNDALASQQQEILLLRRQLELLKQRLDEQAGEAVPSTPVSDEKPPHY